MTPMPYTAREEDDLTAALKIMEKHGVRRLPVTNAEGELTGVLAADDILKVFHHGIGELVSIYKHEFSHEKQARP
jgi:CBS domain-containing protein